MPLSRLDPRAIKKVSGPAWVPLRQLFLDMSEALLDVADTTAGSLTTIYVKYQVDSSPSAPVFAVAWIKTSREIVVGLSMPPDDLPDDLFPPIAGMVYPALTGYVVLRPGDSLPKGFRTWARAAYGCARSASPPGN
jgi:hypothetical protein